MSLLSNITCSVMLASSLTLFAGPPARQPSEMEGQKIQRWMNWWMDEACQQTVPLPQLLFANHPDWIAGNELLPLQGRLKPDGRLVDLYWFVAVFNVFSWDDVGLPSTAGLIVTERAYAGPAGSYWYSFLDAPHLPVLDVKPPQENAPAFFWLKNIRVPETIHSSVFTAWSFAGDDRLTLYVPKQLFWYGRKCFNPFMSAPYDHCE